MSAAQTGELETGGRASAQERRRLAIAIVLGGAVAIASSSLAGCAVGGAGARGGGRDGTELEPPEDEGGLPPGPGGGGVDECGDLRGVSAVYFGTERPTHVPLTEGQILAVGKIGGCSGTLIAPRWVLTATHCGLSRGDSFCMGTDPRRPVDCVRAARVIAHPTSDSTLVELERAATDAMPGVEPVPLFTGTLDRSWIGRRVELAGYGQNERGGYGVRAFTAQPLVALRGDMVSTDGEGRHGVCYGDSGGPMFVIASDGSVRVAGSLTGGDGSCVGVDEYTRVDVYYDWMVGYTGEPPAPPGGGTEPTPPPPAPSDPPPSDPPPSDPPSDPPPPGAPPSCAELGTWGRCERDVAVWCEDGVLHERDCGVCGEICREAPELGGAYCDLPGVPPGDPPPGDPGDPSPGDPGDPPPGDPGDPPPGGDLCELGACTGSILSWCGCDGTVYEFDCAWIGARCELIDPSIGHDCTWF